MPAKNTTQVLIAGKIVTLSGYESEEYLQKVAAYLNGKIAELSELPGYNRQPMETKHTMPESPMRSDAHLNARM